MSKNKPKILSEEERKRLALMAADLPGLMEYAHSVGGFSIVPTAEGVIKGKAIEAMHQQTQSQLDLLKEQMLLLAKQAQSLKDRVEVSHEIYQAKISFTPVIGQSYYLYNKDDGSKLLSLIAPHEWRADAGLAFVAKVKLLADHTWDILQEV